MRHVLFQLLALAVLGVVASPASAQVPSTLSYQGVLTNADGTLVADGGYSLTFRIYDVAVGGAALWSEGPSPVTVERGGFSVILGQLTALALPFDRPLYLGIQVAADPELSPRVALTSSPYALSLRLPFAQDVPASGPLLDVENTGSGAAGRFRGVLQLGSPTRSGQLHLYRNGLPDALAMLYTDTYGGNLDLFDDGGYAHGVLEADAAGSGGFFRVERDAGLAGFTIDGNAGGTGEPRVTIAGSLQAAAFDMAQSGDAAVTLPPGAIAANETLDEAGAASQTRDGYSALDGTVQTLLSRSLTAPASGYCMVFGTVRVDLLGTGTGQFGVSSSAGAFPSTQTIVAAVPAGIAGTFSMPVSVHGLFPVTAGTHTFYLLGQEAAGTLNWGDAELSILYVPTAYGTVAATLVAGDGEVARTDPARERGEAEAFARDRLAREVAAMQAQMAELRRQLDAVTAEQGRPARK